MRNELIDLYNAAIDKNARTGDVLAYREARDRIGPQIVMEEVLDNNELRARLAEVEAQRDGLKTTLDIIQSGFEYRNGDPKMDGTFERFPHVLNRSRMMDIAREGLAKLEETK